MLVVILHLLLVSSLPFFCYTALTTTGSNALPCAPQVLHISQKATHASERCSWLSWQCREANGTKGFKESKWRMISKINMYYSVMSEVHSSCFVSPRACSLSAVRFSVYDWGWVTFPSISRHNYFLTIQSSFVAFAWIPPGLRKKKDVAHFHWDNSNHYSIISATLLCPCSKQPKNFTFCTFI